MAFDDKSDISRTDTDIEPGDVEPLKELLKLPLVLTLSGANFLNTLAVQSAVIILPTIGRDFGVPAARQQWIISSYYVSYGCFLLLWGRLADIYGRRSLFIIGSVWTAVFTIAAPFSSSEILFDVLRAMQGLGSAANVSAGLGILGVSFKSGRAKDYAFSIYGAANSLGTIMGIILGGIISQYLNWRWVFWIFGILAACVAVAGQIFIPRGSCDNAPVGQRNEYVDWIGGLLITSSLVLLTFALTEVNILGWGTPWIPALLAVSLAMMGLFVVWQYYLEYHTSRTPLIKMSIWLNKRFSGTQITLAVFYGSFNNCLIFATYFYQDYLSKSVIETTLYFLPTGLVGLAASYLAARSLSRIRGDVILITSTLCVAIACLLYALPIPTSTSYWATGFVAVCLAAFGADLIAPTLTLLTTQCLKPEDQALGGGICNCVVQIGRVISLAIGTAIQQGLQKSKQSRYGDDKAMLVGLRAVQYFDFGLAVAATVTVLMLLRGKQKIGGGKP